MLLVTGGGRESVSNNLVFAWDAVAETWVEAGQLAANRWYHSIVEIHFSAVANFC